MLGLSRLRLDVFLDLGGVLSVLLDFLLRSSSSAVFLLLSSVDLVLNVLAGGLCVSWNLSSDAFLVRVDLGLAEDVLFVLGLTFLSDLALDSFLGLVLRFG